MLHLPSPHDFSLMSTLFNRTIFPLSASSGTNYNISFTFQSRMVFGRATFLLLSLVFPAAFSYRVSTEEVTVTNFKCSRSKLTILQKWSPSYFNHRYFSGPSASDYPTYIAPKVSFLNKTCSLSMFWKPKLLHHTERINFIHLNI